MLMYESAVLVQNFADQCLSPHYQANYCAHSFILCSKFKYIEKMLMH